VKELYLLAVERSSPIPLEMLRDTFEADAEDVLTFAPDADGQGFSVEMEGARVAVCFEARPTPEDWALNLFTGNEAVLEKLGQAQGFYRLSFRPGPPHPTLSVFVALMCARVLMQHAGGVLVDITALKVHDAEDVADLTELDFDIRDHVNLHAVEVIEGETPLWVHSHGMEKFGARDLEIFHLGEQELLPAEAFMHELCTNMAFGSGARPRAQVGTSEGRIFMMMPSEEARTNLLGVPLEAFEGHEGLFLTLVSPEGRHNTAELLRPYRERFAQEPPERTEAMRRHTQRLLPAFKARFQRRGLMEPLTFVVRAPFETHPEGEAVVEHLWVEVLVWEDATVLGRLMDGAVHTTEWRKGSRVEVEEAEINALAITREGRQLEEEEVHALLEAERPV
jgi:uncharacterized protein YegJ (DUF2314 family)